MQIVYDADDLHTYMTEAVRVSPEHPILVDKFLEDALEIDVDALSDGERVTVGGVMEHVEKAGVHSGDSACALPPYSLGDDQVATIKRQTRALALELGVIGLLNIQFAINFDMLASPNHGKFVYDGDFSHTPPPATAPNVNPGAAYIEDTFVDYFNRVGIPTEPSAFDGRSDYKPFQDNGIAAGGLFSGAEVAKTAAQVAKWGGQVNVAFDPNYHEAGDDIDNLDHQGWEQMADGGAHVLATLAEDRNLRESLAGGATANAAKKAAKAKTRKAKRLSKARKAKLGAYLGDRLVR